MGRKSRDKGASFERLVAGKFSEALGAEYKRTPLSGGWYKGNSLTAGDVVPLGSKQLFCIECKKVERWTLDALFVDNHALFSSWWGQLMGECPEGVTPVLVFSRNRAPIYVAINENKDLSHITPVAYISEAGSRLMIILLDDFLAYAAKFNI